MLIYSKAQLDSRSYEHYYEYRGYTFFVAYVNGEYMFTVFDSETIKCTQTYNSRISAIIAAQVAIDEVLGAEDDEDEEGQEQRGYFDTQELIRRLVVRFAKLNSFEIDPSAVFESNNPRVLLWVEMAKAAIAEIEES